MARKLRIQYPGAIYHLMNRGDHQEPIFLNDHDRERFLATLDESCQKTGWQVHAYCLMSNHFHLVIETPSSNLVEGMKWLLGVYTQAPDLADLGSDLYNLHFKRRGNLSPALSWHTHPLCSAHASPASHPTS